MLLLLYSCMTYWVLCISPFQNSISTSRKEEESVEAETEEMDQTVIEQTQAEASEPQPETEEGEIQAASAGESQAEVTQPENEVSEVEIPNVGKILVLSDADGYNEEVTALSDITFV